MIKIEPNVDFPSSKIFQSDVIKSNNLKFLSSPSSIPNSISKLREDSNELIDKDK